MQTHNTHQLTGTVHNRCAKGIFGNIVAEYEKVSKRFRWRNE